MSNELKLNLCGCKGIRSCAICSDTDKKITAKNNETDSNNKKEHELISDEKIYQAKSRGFIIEQTNKIRWDKNWMIHDDQINYDFCPESGRTFLSTSNQRKIPDTARDVDISVDTSAVADNGNGQCSHTPQEFDIKGIQIFLDFVTVDEEEKLVRKIEKTPYVNSQSGRRKQDFGPKVNFKKKKLRAGKFNGLPDYSRVLYERMTRLPGGVLSDFTPVEMCNLEYCEDRGAHIDPHIDDQWLWGERLVTLNLLSDSVLTFTHPSHPRVCVRVPLVRRSLLIVSGPARHEWLHAVDPAHITDKRIAMTFRELSDEFRGDGPLASQGAPLVDVALTFRGCEIHQDVTTTHLNDISSCQDTPSSQNNTPTHPDLSQLHVH